MINLKKLILESTCPVATQKNEVNLKFMARAIKEFDYGPKNPNNANIKYWNERIAYHHVDTEEEAKDRRCNTCKHWNNSQQMQLCIAPVTKREEMNEDSPFRDDNDMEISKKKKRMITHDAPRKDDIKGKSNDHEFRGERTDDKKRDLQQQRHKSNDSKYGHEETQKETPWTKIDAGQLGYCEALKFIAASSRTCNKWESKQNIR